MPGGLGSLCPDMVCIKKSVEARFVSDAQTEAASAKRKRTDNEREEWGGGDLRKVSLLSLQARVSTVTARTAELPSCEFLEFLDVQLSGPAASHTMAHNCCCYCLFCHHQYDRHTDKTDGEFSIDAGCNHTIGASKTTLRRTGGTDMGWWCLSGHYNNIFDAPKINHNTVLCPDLGSPVTMPTGLRPSKLCRIWNFLVHRIERVYHYAQ